ncbi:hypothetical protein [Halohasta litorea]|uniref:Uncharacterized protein n=1 Tax=Halohasta litorea TaxID=869891 RepID=A0ABD6D843_9EURY|nr:hypothetical protein [Halohasta litorea]
MIEDYDHHLIRTATTFADRITENGFESLCEATEGPQSLFEEFWYDYNADGWQAVNKEVDCLAWAMGVCYIYGFIEHDRGNLAESEAYFFAKDLAMFAYPLSEGVITTTDVVDSVTQYRELLDIKDSLEWANLSAEAKRTKAGETRLDIADMTGHDIEFYLDLSTKQIFQELSDREKQALGVRNVDSRDFEIGREDWDDPWQPLAEDDEAHRLLEQNSAERARRLGLSEEVYSERWFLPHKAVESYTDGCFAARYAELAGATLLDQFDTQAQVFTRDAGAETKRAIAERTLKESDGLRGPGNLALYYALPVELHDTKTGIATRRIPHAVAPHLKATQLRRVYDEGVDYNDVRNFALSYNQEIDTSLDRWAGFLNWCDGPEPITHLRSRTH